jgi:hypothetical protein
MRGPAVAVALLALALGGCGGEREEAAPPAKAPEAVPSTMAPDASQPAVAPDRPVAPAIEGVGLDGERRSLASLRGRPVLVNVWSS